MMNTRAAETVPAAVIIMGKARPYAPAASTTALYPERFDCDDNMSIDCARVIRGMNSIASASTPALAYSSIRARCPKGSRPATIHAPS
jgi:hypothetical protein